MIHFWSRFFYIFAVLGLVGCATGSHIRAYEGPSRQLDEVAIVRCAPFIMVLAVNGNDSYKVNAGYGQNYTDCEIELLPGEHTFDVDFAKPTIGAGLIVDVVVATVEHKPYVGSPVMLNAIAGHVYRIKFQKSRKDWKAWIEDVTRDEKTTVIENRRLRAETKK